MIAFTCLFVFGLDRERERERESVSLGAVHFRLTARQSKDSVTGISLYSNLFMKIKNEG